jgi:small conductance mechanosensitive channel
VSEIFARLSERFGPDAIAGWLASRVPNFIVAVLTFAAFYFVWRMFDRGVEVVMKRADVDATARSFVRTMAKSVILTIGVVSALSQLGIDTASILTSLGIVGLTIGFAARDTLSNLISGIFIFWDRPFVLGDLVEVEGRYGRVERITMRSTRVVTPDGKMLAIPNGAIANGTVVSYTNFPHLRLDIDLTIGVNEDIGRVRTLLLALVADDSRFMSSPAAVVVVTSLNDYNLTLELRAWLDVEAGHVTVRPELREKVYETLYKAGVDMPYETIALAPVQVIQTAATSA